MSISHHRDLASKSNSFGQSIPEHILNEAILIRVVEEKFLELFSQGKMNGTVHTCVGQEFSAACVIDQLQSQDWITSNHRCHGHFISKTKNWQGLIDELLGLESGVCKGIGSSQHLFAKGFLSNGPQGALVPVATGIALYNKKNGLDGIALSFIGEGTLGEGVIYESLNLASLLQVPQLFICENNLYSQSTSQECNLSGNILDRPKAFNIKTFEANTWDLENLLLIAKEAVEYTRCGKPAFLLIKTYRLNAHSKGDDNRDSEEVEFFKARDPLNQLLLNAKWRHSYDAIKTQVDTHVAKVENGKILALESYTLSQLPYKKSSRFSSIHNEPKRMVSALNQAYHDALNKGAYFIGEDISDPYGGAFKVTKDLSSSKPSQVISTPISENGIIGMGIGLALMGQKNFIEIMFGDFMTLSIDQVINNASKMFHMYGFQASAPIRIRTPMGGKRGYGPTHSQSLEKHFLGIDNVLVTSLSSLEDPAQTLMELESLECPAIILENKVDYGNMLWQTSEQFDLLKEQTPLGSLWLRSKNAKPTLTIVSYGETARHIADNLNRFFYETDFIPELICLTKIHPLDISLIERCTTSSGNILVVEDGSIDFGIGSEILSQLLEKNVPMRFVCRIGSEPVPIPSIKSLEEQILPTINRIIKLVNDKRRGH